MSIKQKPDAASNALQSFISNLDIDAVGISSLDKWKGTELEQAVMKLLPQARSVVVLAMEIYPEILNLTSSGRTMGAASLNDLLDRDAEFLYGRLTKAAYDVAKASRNIGLKALPLPATGCPTDARFLKSIFSYKHAGQMAELGKIGWHSLLITPRFGPRVRLSCCLTEAVLEPMGKGKITLECESCGVCIDNCPAGALTKPQYGKQYAINKFACSAFRSASGGCSECMRVCPVGK
ncbi:4Fe-4S dicluster domain-containing protein [Chloroflexota bacterium]